MSRWRDRRFPQMPENLEDFAASLNGVRLEFPNGHCSSETVIDEAGNSHLLIYNLNLLQNELANVHTWIFEGTDAGAPDVNRAEQILNIIGLQQDHVSEVNK